MSDNNESYKGFLQTLHFQDRYLWDWDIFIYNLHHACVLHFGGLCHKTNDAIVNVESYENIKERPCCRVLWSGLYNRFGDIILTVDGIIDLADIVFITHSRSYGMPQNWNSPRNKKNEKLIVQLMPTTYLSEASLQVNNQL